MRRIPMWIVLVLSIGLPAEAQVRNYVGVPLNAFPPTAKKDALTFYQNFWMEHARDTTALCYIRQSLWFKRDSLDLEFHVDSISGRGDQRQALVTRRIFWKDSLVDSLTSSRWLNYVRRVSSPDYGWYIPADTVNPPRHWSMSGSGWMLSLWIEKIFGDPTFQNGINQRPLFHFLYREAFPLWWRAYADSVASLP